MLKQGRRGGKILSSSVELRVSMAKAVIQILRCAVLFSEALAWLAVSPSIDECFSFFIF